MPAAYTKIPRPTLWLVRGDYGLIGGDAPEAQPRFEAEVSSFYISKCVITNEQFRAFRPHYVASDVSSGPHHPAVNVSFDDAQDYCTWYSNLSRKMFRLPTEIEWEFACRAGTSDRYFFGNDAAQADAFVWSQENSHDRAAEVETKEANPAGLYDMLGGVREWTASRWAPYPVSPDDDALTDPSRPEPGEGVVRGGSFRTPLAEMGSGVRQSVMRNTRADDLGFRIVRSL